MRAGALPPLLLGIRAEDTVFLGQQWLPGDVATWEPLPEVLVDAASVCATSRTTATSISGDDLVEAEDALFAADYWVQTSLDGVPILAIKITVGDGAFPLYLAKSATGESVGWMLELGLINDYSPTAGLPAP